MRKRAKWAMAWAAVAVLGCSKDETKATPDAAPAVSASAPAASASAAPSATAAAPPVDCPKGSSGEGSFTKPCDASGKARMMEVAWTGKMDDKGPSFRVVNKSPSTILYGRIAVYFYDKSGKQLDAASSDPAATGDAGKGRPFHSCGGNMFQGVMKPGEKAVITFSCVAKANVPAGATAIEAEMQWVGFSDASEKKVDVYWRNPDLTPDVRKKGGVK